MINDRIWHLAKTMMVPNRRIVCNKRSTNTESQLSHGMELKSI